MTRIIKYICNKCKEEIKGEIFKVDISTPSRINYYPTDGITLIQPSGYDLCATCAKKVKEYLNYD